MLRESAQLLGLDVDMKGVGSPTVDSGIPSGRELIAFTEAVVLRDELEVETARVALEAGLGKAAMVRAAAVIGAFEMVNRLMDAAGVGPTEQYRSMGEVIGVPLPQRFD